MIEATSIFHIARFIRYKRDNKPERVEISETVLSSFYGLLPYLLFGLSLFTIVRKEYTIVTYYHCFMPAIVFVITLVYW
jgi:hypothetical protein